MAKNRTLSDLLRDVQKLIRERSADFDFEQLTAMLWCLTFLGDENGPVTEYERGVAMLRLGAMLGNENTNRLRRINKSRREQARSMGEGNTKSLAEKNRQLAQWNQDINAMMKDRDMAKKQAMRRLRIPASTYYKYTNLLAIKTK